MDQKKERTISNPWGIIILIYVFIAALTGFVILKEFKNFIGIIFFLIISILGIIGTVPNIKEEEIPKRITLTIFIVLINELIFYLIAFELSVFLADYIIINNSFLFVLLNLVFTIVFIFLEIKIFYILKPTYKKLRIYVNDKINFVNIFTFLSIVGAVLLSDFSLGSYLKEENSSDIKALNVIFSISSTSFLGYWLINNFINKIKP